MDNRDIDIAHLYHEATKLFYLDLQRKPPAYKFYKALPPLPLPTDVSSLAVPTLEAVAGTGPTASPPQALDLTTLAGLLFYSAGRIRRRTFAGAGEVAFRAAASAGGLYPVEVYVVCGDLPGLAAGVYHFSPADFALRGLRQGDYRRALAGAAGHDPGVATVPCTLVYSAVFWRSAWKYRVRSYRYCFWDNGTIVANLLATATAAGLPARVLLGFVDAQVDQLLDLDGQREVSTCLMPIGHPAVLPEPTEMQQVPPLSVETVPSTVEELDYPEMARLHAASTLATPEAVVAWRGTLTAPHGQSAGKPYALRPREPALAAPGTLGDVIRQRGSTRRFAREPILFSQLSAMLAHATTGVPADFLGPGGTSLLDVYLIVHAVTDLPAGSYVLTPQEHALAQLRTGDFREDAGHLCFEQALSADASVVVFFMADLEGVLQRFGNRGYRAVQLEAGTVGGKLYLCAGALGLGASGLTFYDDEVTAFFAPHAAGKSPIFVVVLGHTAPENRVRPFRSRLGMRLDALSRRDA
ncbi:MAG TPA: SagB/ThcOx family dehydrogenase [Candidatus Tectomicrobia bacterium]|jgi:SagB-type dehydrogenase family enzyme